MFVIGTAGHVDHGKSTLVRALTGIDPDRLAEEKAREMTIDLGFAWLTLDGIEDEVGVVDVPGHRDFIENMLAGVGGIDLALFVIAADEGVMPQTREHLAILDLLGIQGGIIALTKIDMVEDEEWVELVSLEVAEAFEGTVLGDAPIVPVSAHTGAGIDQLKTTLIEHLQQTEQKSDVGRPRLPIDRAFSLAGFGTVVTGTLTDGQLRIGDEITLEPSGLSGRVRGLQTHKSQKDVARPGSRVAVNITGISKTEAKRGEVLTKENTTTTTTLLDCHYRHLESAEFPLKHNAEVKFFIGSAEIIARARVIGTEKIEVGETGWLQLALTDPVAVIRGERFIIRRPSPPATIGGGVILDAQPGRQHRRFKPDVIQRLETLSQGSPEQLVLQQLAKVEPVAAVNLDAELELVEQMIADRQIVQVGKQLVSISKFNQWQNTVMGLLKSYHEEYPLRLGMSREEIRSRLKLKAAVFDPFVAQSGDFFVTEGAILRLTDHAVTLTPAQTAVLDKTMAQFNGINSPSVKQTIEMLGDAELYQVIVGRGDFVQVSSDVVWAKVDYVKLTESVYNYIRENESITVGDVRDKFDTSRKYAIALLEHLDSIGKTRRVGDTRVLVG